MNSNSRKTSQFSYLRQKKANYWDQNRLLHSTQNNRKQQRWNNTPGSLLTKNQSLSDVVLMQCWIPCHLRLENILTQNKKCVQPVFNNKVCTYMWKTTKLSKALNFLYPFTQNKDPRSSKCQNFLTYIKKKKMYYQWHTLSFLGLERFLRMEPEKHKYGQTPWCNRECIQESLATNSFRRASSCCRKENRLMPHFQHHN